VFDDQPVKDILGDLPLSDPQVLAYLHQMLNDGMTHPADSIEQNNQ
jgi:hypothetical protein